jgi:glucosyl-dolichyl phosphate glucuronosyltransferase
MKISVILCTYNRAQSLGRALASIAAQTGLESVQWEVLVVDNNSKDQTREVVDDFRHRYPHRFRYLFEPRQGLSYARNAGVCEAKGEILSFTDDDAVVDPKWLIHLTAPLFSGEWAGSGGRTLPSQAFSRPRWFKLEGNTGFGGAVCAFFDLGDQPCKLDRPPFGANMAFRREMFERYGSFRVDLGASPNPDIPRVYEDTEFGRRLMAAGERLRYEPAALVYHPVAHERLQKRYLLSWWFDYGRAGVRERGPRPGKWGIPRYLFSATVLVLRVAPTWIRELDPQMRFWYKCSLWMKAGQVAENYRQWRAEKPPRATSRS